MASNRWAEALLILALAGVVGLSGEAGGLAAPDLYPGAETVDVYWMSGVIYSGRACVGVSGLHPHDAYDLIADNSGPPCYDGGVPAAVNLRTLGRSSTAHATLRATMSSGEYPYPSYCDYIEARTVQKPSGEDRGMYRYIHALGTTGQQVDIWSGRVLLLSTDTPIGSTTFDDNCSWDGYHTHQDSGNPTSPWSQPNMGLPTDDDIPVWDPSSWIHGWTYPLPDTDGDDFTDAAEVYLGTDRLDKCPDNQSDDAWPLDINKDRALTVVGDVLRYGGRLGARPGSAGWWQRLDLNTDAAITVTGDVMKYSGQLGRTCYN